MKRVGTVRNGKMHWQDVKEPGDKPKPAKPCDAGLNEFRKFTATFGSELGLKWFQEGVSFGEAQDRYAAHLNASIKRLKAENAELRGEKEPLSCGAVEDERRQPRSGRLSEPMQRFAESIKLPGNE